MEEDEKENLSLEDSDLENLEEEKFEDGLNYDPPEENKAKQLNVGNIFLVIGVATIIIIGVVFIFSKILKSKKEEVSELDKAGSKYIPTIELKDKEIPTDIKSEIEEVIEPQKEEDVDDIIDNLPDDFDDGYKQSTGTAPISTQSSGKSDRPDTRNSISIRKIEGIGGRENENEIKSELIQGALNGKLPYGSYSGQTQSQQRMSKEDYIASLMNSASKVSQASYGNQNQNPALMSQQNKESFYNSSANTVGKGEYLSYASLWDGTIITGALVTAINTDNPGVVIARVTENVYSSYDSSLLLIPEGTLLYATYNSSVNYGQNRVQIAWNLMIRPDGYRVELGNMNGVDAKGQSGTKGFSTNHPFETLKALGLVAVFSIIQTEITQNIKTQENSYVQNAMNDVYSEASKLGNKIIDRALDIKPTITIKQGTQIKFITNTPLELPPVKVNQVNRKYVRTR